MIEIELIHSIARRMFDERLFFVCGEIILRICSVYWEIHILIVVSRLKKHTLSDII